MTQTDPTHTDLHPASPTPQQEPTGPSIPAIESFINREVSWLRFNERVLNEALDDRTPLLERVGFLAIFNSNLDEYFQKRVGYLKRQAQLGQGQPGPDGMPIVDQLKTIREMVLPMLQKQADCYRDQILPALAQNGIELLNWKHLTEREKKEAEQHFLSNLFPVLTPLAVDPGHPFPFISNLSTSLGVMLRTRPGDPLAAKTDVTGTFGLQFARVKVPEVLPGWIRLESETADDRNRYRFISLQNLIHHNVHHLFQGMELEEVEPFRVTRNAAVGSQDEDAEDLLEVVNEELRQRRFANIVRLEVDDTPYRPLNQFLIGEMDLREQDVYEMPGELDYNDLWVVHGKCDKPELKYEPWQPIRPLRLGDDGASIFNVIRSGDVMVHHPYESFSSSVERFISEACSDPNVIAIKLTLYRTAKNSPFIPDLIRAAESGKQVVVLVELKARFDEERNVELARRLEKAGIHVVYGVVGLKTHTKTALVVRREGESLRTYAHIGTGNYNSKTANLYTDLGLFTCDPRLTGDLVQLFHFLTGRSIAPEYAHLLIAPTNMRSRFEQMIQREIDDCSAWRERGADPADPLRPSIVAKMNSLEDQHICRKLYEASGVGVKIDLIVRGFCCLRPGVDGLSENIRVTSIIGRFLEHSRIYRFHNAGQPEYYIGSADWMYRNLNNRVECITPIYEHAHRQRLQDMLDIMLADQRQAWDMQPDGTYIQRSPKDINSASSVGTHRTLMDQIRIDQINAGA